MDRDWGLTPLQSIGATLGVVLLVVLICAVGMLVDRAFQRYMDVTLWRAPRRPFAWVATVWRSTVDGSIRLVGVAVHRRAEPDADAEPVALTGEVVE